MKLMREGEWQKKKAYQWVDKAHNCINIERRVVR